MTKRLIYELTTRSRTIFSVSKPVMIVTEDGSVTLPVSTSGRAGLAKRSVRGILEDRTGHDRCDPPRSRQTGSCLAVFGHPGAHAAPVVDRSPGSWTMRHPIACVIVQDRPTGGERRPKGRLRTVLSPGCRPQHDYRTTAISHGCRAERGVAVTLPVSTSCSGRPGLGKRVNVAYQTVQRPLNGRAPGFPCCVQVAPRTGSVITRSEIRYRPASSTARSGVRQ